MIISSKLKTIVRTLSLVLLIAMLLGPGSSVVATPPDQEGGLFADAAIGSDVRDLTNDPTIVRTRLVEPNFDLLGGTDTVHADVLALNLFKDTAFTAVLDRAELNQSGSLSWIGHLEGVEYGSVILVVKDGVMVGSVKMVGASYQIRYVGDGVHAIQEMNEAAFPPELEPIQIATSENARGASLSAPMTDDGSIIDVLVVYTDDARVAVGGTTAMQNLIDQAIAETNTSYAHSNITQRVNLVHSAEVSYDETNLDWGETLNRLRLPSDDHMDIVHTLRDDYCADEVVLIIEDEGLQSCGRSYLMPSPPFDPADYAFALVRAQLCATGYYSFGHEMGHNMGAHHDRANASGPGFYDYSYGYQAPDQSFRTVMAYNCPSGCTRVDYWSNPEVNYNGQPTGVLYTAPNSADNRRTLNNTAYTVANFRDSSVCAAPPPTYSISGYVRDLLGTGIGGVTVGFGGTPGSVTTNAGGYYEQSGFDEGDYTISFSSSNYFFSPVEDQVTVSGADATHNAIGYPINPVSLPFSDDFESVSLGSAWAIETSYDGQGRVSRSYPHWGGYGLLLNNAVNGYHSYASAILPLDLGSASDVDLSFWWQDLDDENSSQDGVFISDDSGTTWYPVFSFTSTSMFTQTIVDLDAAASDNGVDLNDHFLIKFQFYDNDQISSDGYGIDDVAVNSASAIGPLVYAAHTIDDEPRGTFSNNGDGVVNCGEAVGLSAFIHNQGGGTVNSPTVTITTTDPYVTFISSTTIDYPDIAGWGVTTGTNDFEFSVASNMPVGHSVQFDLNITSSNGGPWSDSFDVTVRCGFAYVYLPLLLKHYPPIPATPVLNTIDNSDEDGDYMVSWDAADRADTYILEEDDNASFTSPVTVYSGTGTLTSIAGKSAGTYYYHVKASNSWGDSGWSNVRSVAVIDVINGDFESGSTGWTEYSTHEWPLIVQDQDLPRTPHSGSWAVWLGGDYDDTSYIQQQVNVLSGSPYLSYWHWIASDDSCGNDYGAVIVNNSTTVDTYNLCAAENTGGWAQHTVNLSAYEGQSISLRIQATTNSSENSNLFIDDVSFVSSMVAAQDVQGSFDPRNTATRSGE